MYYLLFNYKSFNIIKNENLFFYFFKKLKKIYLKINFFKY